MQFEDEGGTEGAPRAHGTIAWALRSAAVAALVGLAATHYLARISAPAGDAVRLAKAGSGRAIQDPETTGSITAGVRAVRIDPCTIPLGSRAGRP